MTMQELFASLEADNISQATKEFFKNWVQNVEERLYSLESTRGDYWED